MSNFFKKMFDFSIDEKQEEKLEVKEPKVTKDSRETKELPREQVKTKKTQIINFEEKKVRFEQEDNKDYNVVVFKPYDMYDCPKVGDWIAKDVIVILNLEDVENSLAQRVVDFVLGSVYIKGATLKKIAKNVQICIPPKMNLKIEDLDYSENESYSSGRDEMPAEEIKPKYMSE